VNKIYVDYLVAIKYYYPHHIVCHMQILDGRNHHRGVLEKFALIRTVELLNTGKYWGWLAHPLVAKNYSPDAIVRADKVFFEAFRGMVDQWIDSGIDENGIETPPSRYVCGLPHGYSESLFDVLAGWLGRHMPKPMLMSDGTIGILDQPPSQHGLEPEIYAREAAIYHLKELLDSPCPHRLARCRNPKCRIYFVRKRERKGSIKRGTYCGNCELIGAAERTRISRRQRKSQLLKAAAEAWPRWKKSNRHPIKAEWVAQQVNAVCGGARIHAKWVTQNKNAILGRMGTS
jgi:hypothetical protein